MFLLLNYFVNSTNKGNRIKSNKRISHHQLMVDPHISGNLRGLLERGVQVRMDAEEVFDMSLEVAISYAGSVGTSLWSEITEDRAQVGLAQFFVIWTKADVEHSWIGWARTLLVWRGLRRSSTRPSTIVWKMWRMRCR